MQNSSTLIEVLNNCNLPRSKYDEAMQFLSNQKDIGRYKTGRAKLSALKVSNNKLVSEYIAQNNYYELYRSCVDLCIAKQKKPFSHVSLYPMGFKNIFTFRVDSDGYSNDSFTIVKKISEEKKIPLTWFIDVSTHDMEAVKTLKTKKHDIEPHCYYHFLHKNRTKSQRDYLKAIKTLKTEGIKSEGIAAPYGYWDNTINDLYEDLGISFASDFSCSYESIPHFPVVNNSISKILQIPVHPICFGTLMEAGFTSTEIRNYFLNYIEYCYKSELPINLYGHPLGRMEKHRDTFSAILECINSYPDIWCPTYTELNDWWRKRVASSYDIHFITENCLEVISENRDPSLAISIWRNTKEFTQIPMISGIYDLETLSYNEIEPFRGLKKEHPSKTECLGLLKKDLWTRLRLLRDNLFIYR